MIKELDDDYGWKEAFGYAGELETCAVNYQGGPHVSAVLDSDTSTALFTREDVMGLIGIDEGDNDGPDWVCAGVLKDGRWFFLKAGCDYTGWDCQAGGCAIVADTKDDLIRFGIDEESRTRMGLKL